MTTPGTRDLLLAAAEQLFAAEGTAGVSSREIVRAAGVGNASALQYHFGDQSGLLRAVVARHEPEVEARRHALLDAHEADPQSGLRGLVAALVLPLSSKLADQSGRAYLKIAAELVSQPNVRFAVEDLPATSSVLRWRAAVEPILDREAVRLHRRFMVLRFVNVELGRRAAETESPDNRLFVSHLIDVSTALLACPTSDETRKLAQRSPRGPG
jgi:AcrR family transcriptional regulator